MTGTTPFHPGEVAVQERVGVHARAARSGAHSIRDHLIEQHRDFYPLLPMLFAGFLDGEGRPWASLLTGEPGFTRASNDRQLRLDALPALGDPLAETLQNGLSIGLLGLQWETRRRNRVNGVVSGMDGAGSTLDVIHAFGNCPKYIQTRQAGEAFGSDVRAAEMRPKLSASDAALIAKADTFFIATAIAGAADVSHRGGKPGFLRLSDGALSWPDYPCNNFFNTLGNIESNPVAGLLIPDWETGAVLQMTGRAGIRWDAEARAVIPGAQRMMTFEPDEVRLIPSVIPNRWVLLEPSPFLDRLKA